MAEKRGVDREKFQKVVRQAPCPSLELQKEAWRLRGPFSIQRSLLQSSRRRKV